MNRYLTGLFTEDSGITIGVDFHLKKINFDDRRVSLQIWDFAGEDRFRFLLPSYLMGASGGIFMFDITRYTSLTNFNDWVKVVEQGTIGQKEAIPILMVGSKLDLEYKRAVPMEDAMKIAKNNGLYGYVECSSKTGQNVEEIFIELTKEMIRKANL